MFSSLDSLNKEQGCKDEKWPGEPCAHQFLLSGDSLSLASHQVLPLSTERVLAWAIYLFEVEQVVAEMATAGVGAALVAMMGSWVEMAGS